MKKRLLLLLTLFGFGLSSCSEYLDINADPSFPQVSDGNALLPPIIANMVRGEVFDTRYVGKYDQYFASSAALDQWDRHGYIFGSGDLGGEKWSTHYWRIGKNVDLMIDDGNKTQRYDLVGIAKAIRAWSWQTSTDLYGEMILKQAWDSERYQFDFDPQPDIYAEVIRLNQEALTDLARTDGKEPSSATRPGDLVYKGDKAKWVKFIYATLARNMLHISNKATFSADKVIEYCDKSLASNADNFSVPHRASSSNDANFFGPRRGNVNSFRVTDFMLSLLDGRVFGGVADPRLPLMFSPAPDGVYRGVVPVAGDPNNVTGNVRRIPFLFGYSPAITPTPGTGKFLFKDDADHPIITYAEVQFMKAEAAFRKGDKTLALDAYKKGVQANIEWTNTVDRTATPIPTADITKYMTSKAVVQTADALTLKDIMLQKYIALFMHGSLETWVDLRRFQYDTNIYTGYIIPTGTNLFPDNLGKPVQRMRPRYNSEFIWNRASLANIGATLPEYHTKELWFSTK
ncbi:SusD/RagB family nutrient-binding outer membrane lipoprotein [Spirosoma flavus]